MPGGIIDGLFDKTLPVEPSPLPLKYNKLYKPADKTNNSARKIQTIKIYTISFPKENMLGKKKMLIFPSTEHEGVSEQPLS